MIGLILKVFFNVKDSVKYIYFPCSGYISEEGGLCCTESSYSCGRASLGILLELLK